MKLDEEELRELLDDGGWSWPTAQPSDSPAPSRPLAQFFDFIEICGGSGVLSDEMNRRGFVFGPIIDITYSAQFDLLETRVFWSG